MSDASLTARAAVDPSNAQDVLQATTSTSMELAPKTALPTNSPPMDHMSARHAVETVPIVLMLLTVWLVKLQPF